MMHTFNTFLKKNAPGHQFAGLFLMLSMLFLVFDYIKKMQLAQKAESTRQALFG